MLSSVVKQVVNAFVKKIPSNKLIFTSTMRNMSTNFEEQKINVKGWDINYVKVGRGAHPVLLLPGALGSIWTDFKPQITNLDKDKLTIVAWDPPGYGNSRPPNRTFGDDFYSRDADFAHDLMKAIGFDKYSLLGWSDGGIVALFLAANYPERVKKMIVIGANAYILPEEADVYKSLRNIDSWSERMRAPMIAVYGEGYFRSTWASWVDALSAIYEKNKGDICMNLLKQIQCPTLIVHGAKDVMVHKDHPTFLAENIKNSKMHIFENGSHTLHLKYHEDFNRLSEQFLLETD
ncbi:valacyclovir hydrolase [Neodiprion lecontei]|uniref:Valacyclovir hydrolase n=1 Tax=Neodiprion lecontei TaxID=441921 RepID=A0A6J0CDR4_NEOLC|nr:valacyclovir hydrolase [Neodiprion lecontei]